MTTRRQMLQAGGGLVLSSLTDLSALADDSYPARFRDCGHELGITARIHGATDDGIADADRASEGGVTGAHHSFLSRFKSLEREILACVPSSSTYSTKSF